MQQSKSGMSCQQGSWALAAGAGLLVLILLLVIGGWGWIGSIFIGAVVFVALGFLFTRLFCSDLPEARGSGTVEPNQTAATAAPAATSVAPAAPAAAGTVAAPAPTTSTETAEAEDTASSEDTTTAAHELPDVHAASAQTDAEAGARVKPSTPLKGQEELSQRKGAWKYEGGASKPAKAAAPAAATPAAAPAAGATPDYNGDGALEGASEGKKPETLSQARAGGADNLKEIKGVGPKLEQLLNSMGFYHFDQIANWTAEEEAWVNANLEGFKGRVSRDEWVKQAQILASGGDTEFSKRVDKGGVY